MKKVLKVILIIFVMIVAIGAGGVVLYYPWLGRW